MNGLEIYTIDGVALDERICEWLKSHSKLKYLPYNKVLDIPNVISKDGTVIMAPLDMIPFRNQHDTWTITAILERKKSGVKIDSDRWQDGKVFWLPQEMKVYCHWPILTTQMSAARSDLILSPDPEEAEARILRTMDETGHMESRFIHPLELVAPAGFNAMAIICNKKDVNLRRRLLDFHHAPTAICTNVERKLAQRLSSKFEEVGVQCFQDQHQRYQLSVCTKEKTEIQRFSTIQNSWIGLHEAALKFFELTV